jgi:hypothetical protein
MASYLAPIPLAYLAATSKSMFKLLAPLVSTTYRDRKIYYFDNARYAKMHLTVKTEWKTSNISDQLISRKSQSYLFHKT